MCQALVLIPSTARKKKKTKIHLFDENHWIKENTW
jgi:hypothetical protein